MHTGSTGAVAYSRMYALIYIDNYRYVNWTLRIYCLSTLTNRLRSFGTLFRYHIEQTTDSPIHSANKKHTLNCIFGIRFGGGNFCVALLLFNSLHVSSANERPKLGIQSSQFVLRNDFVWINVKKESAKIFFFQFEHRQIVFRKWVISEVEDDDAK